MPQQLDPNLKPEKRHDEVHTRRTICNRCQQHTLCYWLRRGIGNIWLCAMCAERTR